MSSSSAGGDRRRAWARALAALAALAASAPAAASADAPSGFALSRFEPAPRGSRLFVLDTLDLGGHLRPALGATVDWAYKPLVAASPDGAERFALVRHQVLVRPSGSLVLFHRLRIAVDVPFAAVQDGDPADVAGRTLGAAQKPAMADARFALDARLLGDPRGPVAVAFGARAWAPTGVRSQFTSDGSFRAGFHASAFGRRGIAFWAARAGVALRPRSDAYADAQLGSAIEGAVAAGVSLANERVLLAPELAAATRLGRGALGRRETPAELLLGARVGLTPALFAGAAIGAGLGEGVGTPRARTIATLEWAPPYVVPDRDADGVLDAVDACPDEPGVTTDDAETNGCPPPARVPLEDTDGDGIMDDVDACPGLPGVRTSDHRTTGCPPPKAPEPPPAVAVVTTTEIAITDAVLFVTDSAELVGESGRVLSAVAEVLAKHPEIHKVRVEGHTDAVGDAAHNDELSARRAASVVAWLVARGVAPSRLESAGYGSSRPIADNATEEGRAKNRRVVFTIAERAP